MTRTTAPKAAALLPVALLTLAGCGGESDDAKNEDRGGETTVSEPSDSTSASPLTTEKTGGIDPNDQEIADAALLTLQDFPPGWEAAPADDSDNEESNRKIAECAGFDYDEFYGNGFTKAESPDFTSENDEEISNQTSLASDEQTTMNGFEIASRPEFRQCAADIIAESVQDSNDDVEVGDITLNELSFGSYGDETLAFRMTIPVSSGGLSIEATGDFVLVRVGRASTQISSFSIGSPFSADELAHYVDVAAQRLTRELAASE